MKMPRTLTTLTILLTLTACDYSRREEVRTERAEEHYQDAIARYKAGDLDAAEAGFVEALRENPGNASARFQLAVLLQESRKDYLGAMCGYRDYELLAASSDKARMARERAEKCELLLARQLAEKYGFAKVDDLKKDLDETVSALANAQAEIVGLRDENQQLRREVDRFKAARPVSAARPSVSTPPPAVRSSTAVVRPAPLPAPAEPEPRPVLAQTRPQDEQKDGEQGLRAAKALLADARGDDPVPDSAPVPAAAAPTAPAEPEPAPAQPRRYRVKPGEGLYGIARANYPWMSEHKAVELIKKANPRKATSVLKPGDELILP